MGLFLISRINVSNAIPMHIQLFLYLTLYLKVYFISSLISEKSSLFYHNHYYDGNHSTKIHSIFPSPNYCSLPNEMTTYPESCFYYTQSQVENEIISPKYPCIRCKPGYTGAIIDMTVPETFPSATIQDCTIVIPSCDLDFPDILGADIRYDVNVIPLTNFLSERIFSCTKCLDGKIPVATIFHDLTNKAFYFKRYDNITFDMTTITAEGNSIACRDPLQSSDFGLTADDSSFDLDANCSLAVIDLAQTISSSTKVETRFVFDFSNL